MPRLVKAKTVLKRFSDDSFYAIERYAAERGITKAEGVRLLVEQSLNDREVRDQSLASFERLIQITEYVFASTIAQNEEQFTSEKQKMIVETTIEAVNLKHPRNAVKKRS